MSRSQSGPPGVPPEEPSDWELIADYITGCADAGARAAVEARCGLDPVFRADVTAAQVVWERTLSTYDTPIADEDVERAWRRLARELDDPGRELADLTDGVLRFRDVRASRPQRQRTRWLAPALAASVVAVLAVGVMYAIDRYAPSSDAVADATPAAIVAGPAQRVAVTLPDGGNVVLAPGSSLRVPERFADDVRRVTLSGRAYFEVAHDATRPFVVHTEGVDVRVLGTEFDMRAWPDAESTEVIVRSGRVAVHADAANGASAANDDALADNTGAILTAGDRGIVDATGTVHRESGVDVDALLSWTSGRLVFERVPLGEVVAELERWYGIEITADSSLGGRRMTAVFDRQSLDTVLQTVAVLVDARVERAGRQIVLTAARSADRLP